MIEKNFNETLVKKDTSARVLISLLFDIDSSLELGEVSLYHHFPLYPLRDGSESVNVNVLFLSKVYGIIVFQCVEYSERVDTSLELNKLIEIDRILFSKILRDTPSLQVGRRGIKINITPAIFFSNCDSPPKLEVPSGLEIVTSKAEIRRLILENKLEDLSQNEFKDLKATIEGSRGIPKPNDRKLKNKKDLINSKGAVLTAIENEIYNFDIEQKRAALFIIDGAQRIRGLAGSGKTIILAMKTAIIHLQYPDAEILYTYYTKTLFDLIKRLITRFYRQFAENDPNWDKIHILHAWGGLGLPGVYSLACQDNNIERMTLTQAKAKSPNDPFGYVCSVLNKYKLKEKYDYSLLDEAQDFPIHFYRVCRQLTKKNRVVWAYDDFQNIMDTKLQSEKETFGKDENGNWFIDFSTRDDELQDMVLHKCYRNPRKILITAFALGLGIYNYDNTKKKYCLVQRLDSNEHWESLGFKVNEGNSSVGSKMVITRPVENSPLLKNKYLDSEDDIIRIFKYENIQDESENVVKLVLDDLHKELNPEDISIICLDDRYASRYFSIISMELEKLSINSFNLLEVPSNNTVFKVKNYITLSTVYRAKGNEAGSIYIIGIDSVFRNKNDITERNKIFTAMTRAHGWVTLTGSGSAVDICLQEFNQLKSMGFILEFQQPSEKEVRTIRQDISKKQAVLNKIERLADELSKTMGISKEEIVEDLKAKILGRTK